MNLENEVNNIVRELRDILLDKTIVNIQRLLILIALYLSKRLSFKELVKITGIDKGRLEYHLNILIKEGLLQRKNYITLTGPRVYLEITSKGEEYLEKIIVYLKKIPLKEVEENRN